MSLGELKMKKKKLNKEDERVQDLINIKDSQEQVLYTKDNYIIGYVKVLPINISLLSKSEKRRKRNLIKEKFNDEDEFEFFKISKSADLSQQINYLEGLARECDNSIKKMGLLESIRATSKYSQNGGMVDNEYYYMFRVKNKDSHSEKDIKDKIYNFVNKLEECEMKAYLLTEKEIVDVCNLFCNPTAYSDDFETDKYIASFMKDDE